MCGVDAARLRSVVGSFGFDDLRFFDAGAPIVDGGGMPSPLLEASECVAPGNFETVFGARGDFEGSMS